MCTMHMRNVCALCMPCIATRARINLLQYYKRRVILFATHTFTRGINIISFSISSSFVSSPRWHIRPFAFLFLTSRFEANSDFICNDDNYL